MINMVQLKKNSRRSWKNEWEGIDILGLDCEISKIEFPYYTLNKQIEHLKNMLIFFENDPFRYQIVNKQLNQAKLLYIFRYEWEFYKQTPFKYNWIYYIYKELKKG